MIHLMRLNLKEKKQSSADYIKKEQNKEKIQSITLVQYLKKNTKIELHNKT